MAGILQQIGGLLQRFFSINRTEITGWPLRIGGNQPVYPDADLDGFVQHGFSGNASVYTIATKDARKFAHIKRGVYQIKDSKAYKSFRQLQTKGIDYSNPKKVFEARQLRKKSLDEVPVENELSKLLDRPNPWQGQDSFFELLRVFYKITGEGFIWLNRGNTDGMTDDEVALLPVLEMYVLPSNMVVIIPDPEDVWAIAGYQFIVGGQYLPVRKVDIIHWRTPNPNFDAYNHAHLRGLSPLKPGNKILTQDDDSTDAMVSMYQNGGAKGVIFDKSLHKLNPQQESDLRNVIDRKINSNKMKAAVAALQGDWGQLDLGLSSVDMQLLDGQERAFVRLCNLLDVPPAIFLTDQTYENKIQSVRDWLNNALIPAACSLRDEMNRVLLVAFNLGPNITTDIDTSDIPELQADLKDMVTWLSAAWWLSPNAKLEYMGEELSTDPNMDKVYIPTTYQALEDVGLAAMTGGFGNNNQDNNNGA